MFVRQVKRKCSVRGCKSTDCFAISRTREVGNTVIICKSCLGKALGAIDEIDPKTKSNIPKANNTAAPSLFFNAKALGAVNVEKEPDEKEHDQNVDGVNTQAEQPASSTQNEEDTSEETTANSNTTYKCSVCGKEYDSEKGLKMHSRYCKPQSDDMQ